MTWTVTKESGAVAVSDWLAEEATAVTAEQRALAEAFRFHPPISLKLTVRGQPDPFDTPADPAAPAGLLRRARSAYEDLLDRLPMMIQLIDASGAIESANRASFEMLGHDPEALVGRQVLSLFTEPARRDLVENVLPRFFATGRLANVAVALVTKGGGTTDVRMTAVGDRNDAGRIERVIAVFAAMGDGS